MMFYTEEVHKAAEHVIADTTLPANTKLDVGKAVDTGITLLRVLERLDIGGIAGWLRRRKVRKAIEVLEAVNETVRTP